MKSTQRLFCEGMDNKNMVYIKWNIIQLWKKSSSNICNMDWTEDYVKWNQSDTENKYYIYPDTGES